MCGIVGALSFKKSKFDITESYIVDMRDTMSHRGPDGVGAWVSANGKIGLGHRRLSIIDLSESANQPMSNEDESLSIVFNGEIYNHADVRIELESIGGFVWKTDHSDTEVILHAFKQWGIKCIDKFRGMFAFAIWDAKKKELWLCRDRLGVKPLYYSINDERIIFASEIKALLKDPGQKKEINEESFYNYLSFLTVPAPNTLFEGIYKLPSATWMRIDFDGNIQEEKYWDVFDNTISLSNNTEEQIADKLLKELTIAVNLRKVSDVPVGVFLSGGIDSSTNTALFSKDAQNSVNTFSIGYDGEYNSYKSELPFAKFVAKNFNAVYHEKILKVEDLIDFLPRMAYLQDEPIADPVCVPLYYVSKLARDHGVIVCQVGEGADELFWGYPQWKRLLNLQNYCDKPGGSFISHLGMLALNLIGKKNSFPYEWLRRSKSNQPVFWGGAEAFTHVQKNRLISKRLKKKFAKYSSWNAISHIHKLFITKAKEKSNLNWMTYLDLNLRLPELLLMRVDKMSMGASLEGRVPFLDHKFVELAMSIPSDMKTKDGTLKYILKKTVKGLIPDEIINRKKQGFGVPVQEWFFTEVGEVAIEKLKRFCNETDLLDWSEVEKLLKSKKNYSAWPLLNVAMWWEEFFDKKK
jgi:asparagine synthase (glutamine-hydrolysing)